MSSTKRGRDRERHDNYPTDAWCVRRFLEATDLPGGPWLEPCAGDGAIIKAVNQHMDGQQSIYWTAVEIRPEPVPLIKQAMGGRGVVIQGDFLITESHPDWPAEFNVAITNPPFIIAMDVIQRCREMAEHTVMLLRLNFIGSEERSEFMRMTRPDIYVLPNRPSFLLKPATNKKGQVLKDRQGNVKMRKVTDSIEYAWFHWYQGSTGLLRVLASTPKEERMLKR